MDKGWTNRWIQSRTPGVRFREHPTRRHGVKRDRYFSIYYKSHGKRREEGLGWASEGWNESKAGKVLADLKTAQRTGEGPQTLGERRELEKQKRETAEREKRKQAREAVTFKAVFDQYLEAAKTIKDSWGREEELFRLWIDPAIGKRPLKDIVPLHLESIRKSMKDAGAAERSFEYVFAVIRQTFHYANRNRIFDGPCPKVAKVKYDNRRTRFLTRKEADTLLEALAKKSKAVRDLAALSLHTGMRAGEIFGLTWGDVDLERGTLTLRDTKNSETRTVFLNRTARTVFENRKRKGPEDLVFPDAKGKRQVQVSKTFNRVIEGLGFNTGLPDPRRRVCFHTLRHTHASWLVEAGIPLYAVRECLGHKSISMTERYSTCPSRPSGTR
jgi:integrase